MKLTVLGSGSTGNAVLIVAGNTRVLVDAGLSAKEIARRLSMVGEDAQRLDAVLVTHEHGDHAGGLRVLLNMVDCPVYISAQTLDAYVSERFNVNSDEPRRREKALRDRVEQIESSRDFRIGEIDFHPVHDSARCRRQFWFHCDSPGRQDRNRDGLRPYHNTRHRTPARLCGDRDRVESQSRHAQGLRRLSVGSEAANSVAPRTSCRTKISPTGFGAVLTDAPNTSCWLTFLNAQTTHTWQRSTLKSRFRSAHRSFVISLRSVSPIQRSQRPG